MTGKVPFPNMTHIGVSLPSVLLGLGLQGGIVQALMGGGSLCGAGPTLLIDEGGGLHTTKGKQV
jgi:hypothetical protein